MPSPWLTLVVGPIATLVSASVAGLYAFRAIKTNREVARMRATLDMMEKFESSDQYRDCVLEFRAALASPDSSRRASLDDLLQPQTDEAIKRRLKILRLLNHYEMIACGFESGVLDKSFYADYMRGALLHDWEVSRPFIDRLRNPQNNPHSTPATIFQNFERVAAELRSEVDYEAYLRRIGRSEDQIRKIILACRRRPELFPDRRG